jgi:hypothetical protein
VEAIIAQSGMLNETDSLGFRLATAFKISSGIKSNQTRRRYRNPPRKAFKSEAAACGGGEMKN